MTDSRLNRRELIRLGLVAAPATLAAACGWKGGILEPRLRAFSRVNDWVGEHVLQSNRRLAPTFPVSSRTPASAFPAYTQTPGFPRLSDPAAWSLQVDGLVDHPQRFDLPSLRALPSITYTVKHHCVEGWTAIGTWTGMPVSALLDLVGLKEQGRFIRFESFDNGYYNGWDLKSAMHPQTILAWAFNDHLLTPAHGAPLRLYSPIKLGYKMTKYLARITVTADRPGGFWEDRGYPWFAGI